MKKCLIAVCLLIAFSASAAFGAEIKPSKKDKCQVCGMLVYMYPDWASKIVFKDGTAVYFDGPKDMMRYYLDMAKYAKGRANADVAEMLVTEYYDLTPIEARSAFFVTGSDVMGPMGPELVPFKSEAQASDFKRDHKGKSIMKFSEITPAVMKGLE